MECTSDWILRATLASHALTVVLVILIVMFHVKFKRLMKESREDVEDFMKQVEDGAVVNLTSRPTDFADFPNESIAHNINDDGVAWNIIRILMVTGNEWRVITWGEYLTHHAGDYMKRDNFDRVIKYCTSAGSAQTYCPEWARAVNKNNGGN